MRCLKCVHFVRDAKCILDSKLNHVDNLQFVGFWIDKQRKTLSPVKQKYGGHFQQTDGWVKI